MRLGALGVKTSQQLAHRSSSRRRAPPREKGPGDHDGVIRWLERGANAHTRWVMETHLRQESAALHRDPRFEALGRRLGLQR